ncbi:enoyl-CoA hydratase-related protein [Mesorhizobium retamae]|uniref:Enoyl-CoA hydratase-related protein n=1 Tax=Mesorhizobium retamae TaxID=2912854 RepID=A0ABS9QDA1_9HYPH|nr:enoyl-CoA hydratase-related protein [Mesorhizobium sp. IRAMC:0171]MCG7505400.1 enoyl-CoA hydratase-related protein [Mesorhizobium sp. IRAMC:0171]
MITRKEPPYPIALPYTDIIYDVSDRIATITINRPKTLNAMTQHTIYELEHAFDAAEKDRNVGVIVLTGSGERAFCSGGDVNWEHDEGSEREHYDLNRIVVDCSKAVIARVNGYAIGGGNHLAYFCDITIAAEHAIFGQNGPRIGSPAGGYMVSHSANILGHKRAREMWLLCRRYTAAQMLDWGMVNAVVPLKDLDAEVRKWADELLAISPTCMKIVKASMRNHMDHVMETEMLDIVARVAPGYFQTGEQKEGTGAFLEKRKPNFDPFR